MVNVFFAEGKDKEYVCDYADQKAFGIITPQDLQAWLGPEPEQPSLIAKLIPKKSALDSLSAKFALADAKRKDGGLP